MSNYFEIFFSNVKIQRKLQKHNFLFLFWWKFKSFLPHANSPL
jgi:hypothetical protein